MTSDSKPYGHYSVLCISGNASKNEVILAFLARYDILKYKRLIVKNYTSLEELQSAFDTLVDDNKRLEYDQKLNAWLKEQENQRQISFAERERVLQQEKSSKRFMRVLDVLFVVLFFISWFCIAHSSDYQNLVKQESATQTEVAKTSSKEATRQKLKPQTSKSESNRSYSTRNQVF